MLIAAADSWLVDSWSDLWQVPVSALLMLVLVIVVVRIIGLRSFSKMSSFDFAVTVSIGSVLAGVATTSVALANGAAAAASLLGAQAVVSLVRSRRPDAERVLDNTPILLMDGPEFLEENLLCARVTQSDVVAKLREANVLRMQDVCAVVLETTGDISVLHGEHPIDPVILEGLRRGPATDELTSGAHRDKRQN